MDPQIKSAHSGYQLSDRINYLGFGIFKNWYLDI